MVTFGDDESSQDSFGESQQAMSSQTSLQDGQVQEKSGQSSEYEDVISGEAETLDVLTFVKDHMSNGGVLELMSKYCICLAAQRNKKWPSALADVFVKVYNRLRKHLSLPSEFIRDDDEVYTGELVKVILVATELTLDKLLTAKSKSSSSLSPASSPRGGQTGVSPIRVGPVFSSKFLANDIEYLHCLALDKNIHGDSWLEIAIRVNWAKARYLMLQGQMEIAMIYLDRCTKLLAIEVSPLSEPVTVKLVNCKIDNTVTLEQVHKKLESLQRCQSLEEVHRLYELGHYEDVVQLLMPTLHQPQPKTKASELGMSIPERPAQLLLLQDSLIKLKDFRKCLECTEVALSEAVSQMTPCEAWSTTLMRLFQCMNMCIDESQIILDGFPQNKLVSLTLNIIKVIEASIYSSDVSMEPPLATAYPWVLLFKIIKSKEKDEDMDVDPPPRPDPPVQSKPDTVGSGEADTSNGSNDAPTLPASLQFLRTAHDQLGRRGWCCNNDGIFLLLSINVLTQQLTKPFVSSREDIVRDLEQCFLCLYGHPTKKAKLRGLQEHNSSQMPLTWQNSAVVFDYFKPSQLPTFDLKTYTISTEVQNLMRRITLVVPSKELEAISFDNVQAFIDGLSEEVPKLPENLESAERPVVGELFYLLADFYFKNKEFSKALKFYTHDICVKPNRSDSWAAMALIRKSRLESKLNACEPKSAGPIQKHAVAALRCFKRAMETDSTNSSILEEYGSLCYFLHSHASRQLKQFDEEEGPEETRSSLLQRKKEMLQLSEEIFSSALGMADSEAWLHHYMLGKIAEKLGKPPQVYLEHYATSARYLDEDIKHYPRKIPFYSPPEHVLEALEIYYRIHLSVLKLLLKDFRSVDCLVVRRHLQLAAKGPFFQPEYDIDSGHALGTRSESATSEISSESEKDEPPAKKRMTALHYPEKEKENKSKVREMSGTLSGSTREFSPPTPHEQTQKDMKSENEGEDVSKKENQGDPKDSEEKGGSSSASLQATSDHNSIQKPDSQNDNNSVVENTPVSKSSSDETKQDEKDHSTISTAATKPPGTTLIEVVKSGVTEESSVKGVKDLTPNAEGLASPNEETSKPMESEGKGSITVAKNDDIEMKKQKDQSSKTESVAIQAKMGSEDVSVPMETEVDETVKQTTGKESEKRDTTQTPTKTDVASCTGQASSKEVSSNEPISSVVHVTSSQDTDKSKLTLNQQQETADSDKSVSLSERNPEKAKDQPMDIEPTKTSSSSLSEQSSSTSIKADKQPATSSAGKVEINVPMETTVTQTSSSDKTFAVPSDPKKMETEASQLDTRKTEEKHIDAPLSETSVPLNELEKQTHRDLIDICIHGLEHCLLRFPQHHKSRYRLAYVHFFSPYNKDVQASRALLLGDSNGKKLSRNPQQGLFNEKSKTNMFSAFWRIPEEDIDRPGSFCTHTYKSVDLLLQVLKYLNEWDSLLNVSNLLHRTPEAGKKYLRDNERNFLAKKACDFTVEIMTKRIEAQDPQFDPASLSQLVMDAYECWKISQKYEQAAKVSENQLVKAFEMYRARVPDSPSTPGEVSPMSTLEKALKFCQQFVKPQTSSVSTTPQTPVESSLDSQTDDVIEPSSDVTKSLTTLTADQKDATARISEAKPQGRSEPNAAKIEEVKNKIAQLTSSKGSTSSSVETSKVKSATLTPSTSARPTSFGQLALRKDVIMATKGKVDTKEGVPMEMDVQIKVVTKADALPSKEIPLTKDVPSIPTTQTSIVEKANVTMATPKEMKTNKNVPKETQSKEGNISKNVFAKDQTNVIKVILKDVLKAKGMLAKTSEYASVETFNQEQPCTKEHVAMETSSNTIKKSVSMETIPRGKQAIEKDISVKATETASNKDVQLKTFVDTGKGGIVKDKATTKTAGNAGVKPISLVTANKDNTNVNLLSHPQQNVTVGGITNDNNTTKTASNAGVKPISFVTANKDNTSVNLLSKPQQDVTVGGITKDKNTMKTAGNAGVKPISLVTANKDNTSVNLLSQPQQNVTVGGISKDNTAMKTSASNVGTKPISVDTASKGNSNMNVFSLPQQNVAKGPLKVAVSIATTITENSGLGKDIVTKAMSQGQSSSTNVPMIVTSKSETSKDVTIEAKETANKTQTIMKDNVGSKEVKSDVKTVPKDQDAATTFIAIKAGLQTDAAMATKTVAKADSTNPVSMVTTCEQKAMLKTTASTAVSDSKTSATNVASQKHVSSESKSDAKQIVVVKMSETKSDPKKIITMEETDVGKIKLTAVPSSRNVIPGFQTTKTTSGSNKPAMPVSGLALTSFPKKDVAITPTSEETKSTKSIVDVKLPTTGSSSVITTTATTKLFLGSKPNVTTAPSVGANITSKVPPSNLVLSKATAKSTSLFTQKVTKESPKGSHPSKSLENIIFSLKQRNKKSVGVASPFKSTSVLSGLKSSDAGQPVNQATAKSEEAIPVAVPKEVPKAVVKPESKISSEDSSSENSSISARKQTQTQSSPIVVLDTQTGPSSKQTPQSDVTPDAKEKHD